jgi:hypothetical protein
MSITSNGPTPSARPIDRDAQASLMRLTIGYRVSQMLYVVAKLAIADLLAGGPRTCQELARLTDSDAPSLYRVLRALADTGVFREQADGHFTLTASAELLRSEVPGSVRGYVIMQGEDWIWDAWGRALHSVQTGEPAFNQLYGVDFFTYLDGHPDAAEVFNSGMTGRAAAADVTVVQAYDFSGMRTIVDIGGGHGLLLSSILESYPAARGELLELRSVADGAREGIAAAGLAARCKVVGGDFFTSVPNGGDCYILANVIHDWDDEPAVAILRNCHRAMATGARVLIIEALLPTGNEPHPGKIGDLQMLVISGGRERAEAEYGVLLVSSGFRLGRVIRAASPVSVVEGIRE